MASYIVLKLSDSFMREVNASIITIGDELLIGQTIDTNSAFIGQELNRIGIWVKKRIAIGDSKIDIIKALSEEGKNHALVIITGGLGPTADDITKPTLCDFFNTRLIVNETALQNVKEIFTSLNRPLIERNLKQAEVPENCIVLPNKRGTAPGMWFGPHPSRPGSYDPEQKQTIYISLPGVPHEMKGLITDNVIPALEEMLDLPSIIHRTLLTSGIGESMLAEHIAAFETALPEYIKLAYLPAYGLVRLRLTCRHDNKMSADSAINYEFDKLKSLVSEWKVADENIPLENAVNELLRSKQKTFGTAESCTGGYIAHLVTSIPGSSEVFKGSIVSYANEVKENLLGV
ncbi:MAG: molybdopterin-binding protein, partial [Flavisolibacter sp.]